MLQIVMPMAGRGERFKGYNPLPKPAIPVAGKPMMRWAIESLPLEGAELYAVVLEEHEDVLAPIVRDAVPDARVITIREVTEGAACTVLRAMSYLRSNEPLLISDCDRYAEVEWRGFFGYFESVDVSVLGSPKRDFITPADAGTIVFRGEGPRWSYCRLAPWPFVRGVAEKSPISDLANAGLYYWHRADGFALAASKMMAMPSARVNGEWYVAPVFNHFGGSIVAYEVKSFEPLGTPEDVRAFEARRGVPA